MKANLGYWAAIIASAAALFWVVNGVAPQENAPGYRGHYYESLVDGFRRGQLNLTVEPLPELLRLKDPYDAGQNAPYRLTDASLYRGKYYLYFGPTPAVVLMLPWRVLTGRPIPERLAAVVFAALALAGLGRLLWAVRDRHFPGLSNGVLALILLVAMHATWLPVTLRRPGFWELPHVAALACLWWSLYFLWRLRSEPGRLRWAIALGIGLSLLLGSRPTFVFAAGAILLLAAVPTGCMARLLGSPENGTAGTQPPTQAPALEGPSGQRSRWAPWIPGCIAGGLVSFGGGLLLLYNYARFGNPLEFGTAYQLTNVMEMHLQRFQVANVLYNAWLYLASLPDLSPYFPFVKTVWPGAMPPSYVAAEEMHGAFFAMPVHFAGWAAILWAWTRRKDISSQPVIVALTAGAATSLLASGVLFSWGWACSRYLTELTGGWTVATSIGLMVLFAPVGTEPRAPWRRPLKIFAALACAWTVAYVWLASFEHGSLFRHTDPASYTALARTLDYPSLWESRREGIAFGPAQVTVGLGPFKGPENCVLLANGRTGMMNRLLIHRIDPSHVQILLLQNEAIVAQIHSLEVSTRAFALRVDAPWLYPPSEHPYWDSFPDPRDRNERQTLFSLHAGGRASSAHTELAFDPIAFSPFILAKGQGASAWVESFSHLGDRAPLNPSP
jgi:hypothetical protein